MKTEAQKEKYEDELLSLISLCDKVLSDDRISHDGRLSTLKEKRNAIVELKKIGSEFEAKNTSLADIDKEIGLLENSITVEDDSKKEKANQNIMTEWHNHGK